MVGVGSSHGGGGAHMGVISCRVLILIVCHELQGNKRRWFFDRWSVFHNRSRLCMCVIMCRRWVDWQLLKSTSSAGFWYKPDAVVSLGDNLDEVGAPLPSECVSDFFDVIAGCKC